ncbi:MAG: hypothetical protein LBH78_01775 [Rickettsiales bacterium]|jgi:hypothetical protein|nr:hypothetical protein [Rickettsiales bacterium]
MTITGSIQLSKAGDQIQLIISQSQYKEFQEYKNVDKDDNAIDQKFCAGFKLSDKELYVIGSFQQKIMPTAENEEVDVDSASLQPATVSMSISSVITQDNKQLDEVSAMAGELGLGERNTEIAVELFNYHKIQNEVSKIGPIEKEDDDGNLSMVSSNFDEKEEDEQSEASYISEGEELPAIENMTPQQLQDELSQAREHIQQLEQGNQGLIEEQNKLWEEKEKIKNDFIAEQQSGVELSVKRSTYEQINGLNAQIKTLKEQLEAKDQEIAKLKQQPLNAKVEKLNKDLEAKNTEVEKLQKEKKELEAKKQPTEQSKAPTYTAAVGVGLAAGLVVFIALERTVRLDIWTMVGIALASALAVSGATYLALKPSTQVNETQEPQNANVKVPAKS